MGTRALYQSDDAGVTWRKNILNRVGPGVITMAFDVDAADTLYLGTGGGLFKSLNNGQSWVDINSGLNKKAIYDIRVDPHQPAIIYGRHSQDIFKSSDYGTSWRALRRGLENQEDYFISDFDLSFSTPNVLYLLGRDDLFKSTDAGETWHIVAHHNNNDESKPNYRLMVDPQNPEVLYGIRRIVGSLTSTRNILMKSDDGGATWAKTNTGLGATDFPLVGDVIIGPSDSETLYAGLISGGLYRSLDGAASWQLLNFANEPVRSLAIHPITPSTLYACISHQGIFKSTDNGQNWVELDIGFTGSFFDASIIISPSNSNVVYALVAASHYVLDPRGTIYQSLDGGDTWALLNHIDSTQFSLALNIDPQHPDTIYVAANGGVYTRNAITDAKFPFSTVWWDPSKSGQGFTLLQRDNMLWGEWHHYDSNGDDAWLLFQGEIIDQKVNTDLLRFSGPALGSVWDTRLVRDKSVGTIRIELASPFSMLLSYQVDSSNGTLTIEPFQPNATGPYTGIWWDPNTSGQGFALQQQDDIFWGFWNHYDENGIDQWFVFKGHRINNVVNTSLLRFRGPPLATNWDVSQVSGEPVGEASLHFPSPGTMTFRYALDQVSGELQLIPFH